MPFPKITTSDLPTAPELRGLRFNLERIVTYTDDLFSGDVNGRWTEGRVGRKDALKALASELNDLISTAGRMLDEVNATMTGA